MRPRVKRCSRAISLLAIVALLAGALAAIAPAGATVESAPDMTVRAVVRVVTVDPITKVRVVTPFPGVEVWLNDGGAGRYGCTNVNGVVVFRELTPWTDHSVITGVSVNTPRCLNADFLHPVTGDKLFNVGWNRHYGDGLADTFQVAGGETKVVLMAVRPAPKNQRRVCTGFRVTWIGTPGDDTWTGTASMDVANALGGNDTISGGDGRDVICGGPGADVLGGESGNDILNGESGPDTLTGGTEYDLLLGGPGLDWCSGEQTIDCETEPLLHR